MFYIFRFQSVKQEMNYKGIKKYSFQEKRSRIKLKTAQF